MSKAILLSIHPKWAAKIYADDKWIEWRKSIPKQVKEGTKVYLYETAPMCKITGYFFWTNEYLTFDAKNSTEQYSNPVILGCVPLNELKDYQGSAKQIFGWISNEWVKLNKPLTLADFGLKRPPQSWQYVEVK